jgi:hypothetical protein
LHRRLLLEPAYFRRETPPNAPIVAVTHIIAFRPWPGDLIVMNAELAKPIPY